MHYVGTAIVSGVAYAVYSALDMPMKKLWAEHVTQLGDVVLCDRNVKVVECGEYRIPDEYMELPLLPRDSEYE